MLLITVGQRSQSWPFVIFSKLNRSQRQRYANWRSYGHHCIASSVCVTLSVAAVFFTIIVRKDVAFIWKSRRIQKCMDLYRISVTTNITVL